MLQEISIACPIITLFISNCYMESDRSFVLSHKGITSKEGTIWDNTGGPSKGSLHPKKFTFTIFSKIIHILQQTQK